MQFEPSGRPPSGPQRSHWYAKVMGSAPDHVPTLAVRARASVGVPVTEGSEVLSGGPVVGESNDDWLFTPRIDGLVTRLKFGAYKTFAGPEPTVSLSTDYIGYGDPADATWSAT